MLAKTARGDDYRWVKPAGARNEVLDCTVYALFCAQMLDLHKYSDLMWRRLESALEPDLFDAPAPPPAEAVVVNADPADQTAAPQAIATPAPPMAQPPAVHAPAPSRRRIAPPASTSIASDEWSTRL